MKILMITPQPFFEPRGTPISVYQRLQGLSKLGHTIDLLTYHLGESVDFPGVTIHRIPRIPFITQLKVGPSWPKLPLDILLFFKAIAMLLRNHYDVIHSHEEAAFFSIFLAGIFRIRHIYDMHSSLPRQLVNFNFGNNKLIIRLFEYFERTTISLSDVTITIGHDLEGKVKLIQPGAKQMMIENLPIHSNNQSGKGERDSAGILREKLGLGSRLAIVYTGTFEKYQGVGLLIESAVLVRDRYPNVSFILVGGKPDQVQLYNKTATERKLDGYVVFTGTLPVEEANEYLEMADILVSPRIEGTSVPLKIYTYLLCGKPIVATRLMAHTMVLDDSTSILVEPTKEAMAEGLLRALSDPALRVDLGGKARELAREKYDSASYLAKLDKVYQMIQHTPQSIDSATPSIKKVEGN